jgi:hypothetical protein
MRNGNDKLWTKLIYVYGHDKDVFFFLKKRGWGKRYNPNYTFEEQIDS